MKILFIADFPPPEGGVTVLVKLLADTLSKENDIVVTRLDTMLPGTRTGRSNSVFDFFYTFILYLFKLLLEIPRHDVVTVHLPSNKLGLYAIPALIFSKIFRKRLILRKFGGTDFYTYNWLIRTITNFTVRHSYKYLCETKALVTIAKEHGISNVEWFPNHRNIPQITRSSDRASCTEFIYVGQIREEKGLVVLADALSQLPVDSPISITLIGPICDNVVTEDFIAQTPHMKYGGLLPSTRIHETMAHYDCFIFPSYWPGEGYPGALIEALSIGLPAIVSDWRAIPEVVTSDCALFVPVQDSDALAQAINLIAKDKELWVQMSQSAIIRGQTFSTNRWADSFLLICSK